jgi:hypothetical protein
MGGWALWMVGFITKDEIKLVSYPGPKANKFFLLYCECEFWKCSQICFTNSIFFEKINDGLFWVNLRKLKEV